MHAPEPEQPPEREAPAALPPPGTTPRPCRVCGYHAPSDDHCPHCGFDPREPSLRGRAPGAAAELWTGATALAMGARELVRYPRAFLWIAPPVVLTVGLFMGLMAWTLNAIHAARTGAETDDSALAEQLPAWLVPWILAALEGGMLLAALLVGAVLFWFAFSLVFEAFAGPFLGELHARYEERWFGADPRRRLERPAGITSERAARLSWTTLATGAALALGLLVLATEAATLLRMLGLTLAPALVMALVDRPFGRWLLWAGRIELDALRASLFGLALTGTILVLALPLLLVPLVGSYLYGAAAGFGTSLSLLDIPFGRRGLGLRDRLRFLRQHPLATTAFGVTSGLLFGIPFLGPLLVVPAASVGGLWLFCRLDKTGLRRP